MRLCRLPMAVSNTDVLVCVFLVQIPHDCLGVGADARRVSLVRFDLWRRYCAALDALILLTALSSTFFLFLHVFRYPVCVWIAARPHALQNRLLASGVTI